MLRSNKYNAKRVEVDGIRFSSRKEAARYDELKLLESRGVIRDLELQPIFRFKELSYDTGRTPSYRADFSYIDQFNQRVIEDVKGFRNPKSAAYQIFRIKKALVKYFYDAEVIEV